VKSNELRNEKISFWKGNPTYERPAEEITFPYWRRTYKQWGQEMLEFLEKLVKMQIS